MPLPRAQLVHRSHLAEQLAQGMAGALTLVSAPAGFGKTTLLAQWLTESNTPVAWLSLESEDNEPVRFLSYLIAALQRLDPGIGTTALSLLHTPQPVPLETVLARTFARSDPPLRRRSREEMERFIRHAYMMFDLLMSHETLSRKTLRVQCDDDDLGAYRTFAKRVVDRIAEGSAGAPRIACAV